MPERKISEEMDLRKVSYPYLCKCGWWRDWKARVPRSAWNVVHEELEGICREVDWVEEELRGEPEEWMYKYWEDYLLKLKRLHQKLLYEHQFLPSSVHEPVDREKSEIADPYVRRPVASPDANRIVVLNVPKFGAVEIEPFEGICGGKIWGEDRTLKYGVLRKGRQGNWVFHHPYNPLNSKYHKYALHEYVDSHIVEWNSQPDDIKKKILNLCEQGMAVIPPVVRSIPGPVWRASPSKQVCNALDLIFGGD